ncbi:MAG TPA: precorrin-8X methylmutase [Corynebacterium sp.]|jgi:precorrin-8X/cobalt-precorrin-8 methylmutase|uniref:precorrin-8X methylmutase n=1 Tax=Corynebacterium sp. TaxID=1720 RepID=UPI001847255C|nr:precorrin-8X methylmutase [Corynebacterium sp.]MDY0114298.1 precorrin-8X methylmutase [Corynebacterium sp.]HHT31006.1 precorrin-8X methylmutase [Corynebacterium sp.]
MTGFDYVTDGSAIYRESFTIIRAESDLGRFSPEEETVAVRMIHAAGQTDLAEDIVFSPGAVSAARAALEAGKPIFTDVTMIASGITRRRLPADNEVICTLNDERTPGLAAELGTTRTAAAVDLWGDRLEGAVVAIGNAPTALYHLLDRLRAGELPMPAAILAIPVGFVGAVESKQATIDVAPEIPGLEYITVTGRRGGSAITCAALNALATKQEILP